MNLKIKIAVIFLSLPLFFVVAFKAEHALAQQAPQQQKGPTAGEKFKNIKVLNDLPADQMGKVMNLFAASLGTDCNFCHEGENYEKDGKRAKEDARKMIRMTMGINKENFNGRPQVTCNSCHNGHHEPTPVPNLNPEVEPPRPEQPKVKPTVDQIIDKYVTALGGKDKLSAVTSRSVIANRIEPDGKTMEPETLFYKGGKYVGTTTYSKGSVTELYDGSGASKFAPSGRIDLKADESEQIKREAELFSPANIKSIYKQVDFRFLDRIDGREVYMLTAQTASGVRERLYFDVLTGLLTRRMVTTPTMMGTWVYQVDYSDYKSFGGVKVPTTVKYSMPGIRWTRKIIKVKNNAVIDDSVFTVKN